MIGRVQPPVHSSVSVSDLISGLAAAARLGGPDSADLRSVLLQRFDARDVMLTDSGTSALVLAMRVTAGATRTVALPGWSCVDLAAAAIRAGVRVRFYDVDPKTLSPDTEDLRRTISRGVDAVVVVHLFGFPADMERVLRIAGDAGVQVIEDAAQAAGGALHGRALGSWGDVVVLSFGRGKGVSGGGGGALLLRGLPRDTARRDQAGRLGSAGAGLRNLVVGGAQWLLGRPELYAIPAGVPWLRLGEMVYHPAAEPRALPRGAVPLVLGALQRLEADKRTRQLHAQQLLSALAETDVRPVRTITGGQSGYLRLPVLAFPGSRGDRRMGIVRPYPGTLVEQKVLEPLVQQGERAGEGSAELAASLFTLPTHALVDQSAMKGAVAWAATAKSNWGGAVELVGGS